MPIMWEKTQINIESSLTNFKGFSHFQHFLFVFLHCQFTTLVKDSRYARNLILPESTSGQL